MLMHESLDVSLPAEIDTAVSEHAVVGPKDALRNLYATRNRVGKDHATGMASKGRPQYIPNTNERASTRLQSEITEGHLDYASGVEAVHEDEGYEIYAAPYDDNSYVDGYGDGDIYDDYHDFFDPYEAYEDIDSYFGVYDHLSDSYDDDQYPYDTSEYKGFYDFFETSEPERYDAEDYDVWNASTPDELVDDSAAWVVDAEPTPVVDEDTTSAELLPDDKDTARLRHAGRHRDRQDHGSKGTRRRDEDRFSMYVDGEFYHYGFRDDAESRRTAAAKSYRAVNLNEAYEAYKTYQADGAEADNISRLQPTTNSQPIGAELVHVTTTEQRFGEQFQPPGLRADRLRQRSAELLMAKLQSDTITPDGAYQQFMATIDEGDREWMKRLAAQIQSAKKR